MSATSKKIFTWIAPFLIAPLIVPVAFFGNPKESSAQFVPVTDIPALPSHTNNAVQNTTRTFKEFSLDAILTVLAKTLIKQISRSTIQWINSGFQGSPAFIQNPGQFFEGVADSVAGQFIEQLGLGFLCEPFRIDLNLQIQLEYGGGGSYTDEIGCTLSDVIANVDGFLEGDFTQGGWDGWLKVTQKRNNRAVGAYLSAKSELDFRISTAQGQEALVLNWGDGFKSLTDGLGNILTPGATIEATLSETLGTDLRQLELADEINEIMGALVGQLMTQVMSATGLAGASGSSYNDGYSTGRDTGGPQTVSDPEFNSNINQANSSYDDLLADIESDIGVGTVTFENTGTNETGTLNIALRNEETKQSGTRESFLSEKAVDGNTSGNLNDIGDRGSVSITDAAENPWWNINLRSDPTDSQDPAKPWALGKIEIFPRTSDVTNTDALGDFRIFVSNTPFNCSLGKVGDTYPCSINGVTLNPATQPAGLSNGVFATQALRMPSTGPFDIDLNVTGKFVHIQRIDATANSALGIPARALERVQLAEVKIFRNNAPLITVNGSSRIALTVNEPYTDEGGTAFDQSDAEKGINAGVIPITTSITFNSTPVSNVDTSQAGTYTITYRAVDSGGAVAKKTRTVTVQPAQ